MASLQAPASAGCKKLQLQSFFYASKVVRLRRTRARLTVPAGTGECQGPACP